MCLFKMDIKNGPQYLPISVVQNTLEKIMIDLSNKKDRRFSAALKRVPGKPNTFHIISPESYTYDMNRNLATNIFKEFNRLYPKAIIGVGSNEQIGTGKIKSNFSKILINNSNIVIRVFLNHSKKIPEALRPGIALEEYVTHMIKDNIKDIKDWMVGLGMSPILHKQNISMEIQASGGNKILITNITGVRRVGGANKKPDVLITCRNVNRKPMPNVKISLKQSNFGFWSSANRYNEALYILENAVISGKVKVNTTTSGISSFDGDVDGIYVPATKKEISKYCFGEGIDKVDYIIIDGSYQGMDEFNVIHMNCNRFYKNTFEDIDILQKDVFLLISEDIYKSPSGLVKSTNFRYKGFDIQFVNGENIKKGGKKYIQVNRP